MKSFSLLLACLLAACQAPPLKQEPWANAKPNSHVLGAGAGWGWADFDLDFRGTSGFLDGRTGADGGDLNPKSGGALRYQYIVDEHLRLGAAVEIRRVEPGNVAPLGIGAILPQFQGKRFTSYHLLLQPRWYFDPIGESKRWQMFVGADIGWIPYVHINGTIVYGGGVSEPLAFRGDDYFTVAPGVGGSYLLTDNWTFDFGALYEFPLGESKGDVPLLIVASTGTNEVQHEGLILFWTLSYQF